ncbi:MAG: hemolysin III family protein [Acidobacteria bacterium]|nr:hemolysin III family protein [Acidobacteriota bacterium]
MNRRTQSAGEEIANSVTHGVGAALAIAGLVVLLVLAAPAGDPWRIVSFAVYGASMTLLYLASTLYHAVRNARAKRALRVLDHVSIYLLIAGTYTPFTLVSLRGPWGWSLFGAIWGLAITGIVFKCFFTGRFRGPSVAIYVGMGWLALVALGPTLRAIGIVGFGWLLAGGAAYTAGIVFYAKEHVRFGHAVWHLFVLGGSALHYIAVLLFVLPSA